MSEPQRRVAMSLLAHPDDAEMQCAGTLIRLADAGWEIHIATVANGDCGTATLRPAEIAAIRRQEGIAAAGKIGATYHCLDEPDVKLVVDKSTIQNATDLFRQVAPRSYSPIRDTTTCSTMKWCTHWLGQPRSVTRSRTHRRFRSWTARQFPGYTIVIRSKAATRTRASSSSRRLTSI